MDGLAGLLVYVLAVHLDAFRDELVHVRCHDVLRWILVVNAVPPSVRPAVV
jgi:hypothetical protein